MASSPSTSLATLRPDLAGSLMEFDLQANQNGFVGQKIAPVLEVDRQSGNFGRIPIEELLKTRSDTRAPGADYSRGNGKFEPDTYICTEHGTEEPVDDREAEMYRDYFDAELIAATRARHIVLQNYETRVITAAIAGATAYVNTPTVWTDTTNATPITDITLALDQLYTQIGSLGNVALCISWRRFNVLKNCQQIIDRVKYSGFVNTIRDEITPQIIAQSLGINELIVAGSVQNTANEGAAAAAGAATIGSLWTDTKALLFKRPVTMDVREPAFMRTFHWAEDGSNIGAAIETYRDERVRGDVVRARMDTQEKTMYGVAGVLLTI